MSGLEVSRRERGSGLKSREVMRSDIKCRRKTLTYTTICRESLLEENIWLKERETGGEVQLDIMCGNMVVWCVYRIPSVR